MASERSWTIQDLTGPRAGEKRSVTLSQFRAELEARAAEARAIHAANVRAVAARAEPAR